MFSIAFQLAGSILLSWMVLSRNKNEIIQSCWTVINNKELMEKLAYRQFKEKYMSVFGFIYITIGYLIQLIYWDDVIRIWFLKYNPLNNIIKISNFLATLVNILFLFTLGLLISKYLSNYICEKINFDDFEKNIPMNAICLDKD